MATLIETIHVRYDGVEIETTLIVFDEELPEGGALRKVRSVNGPTV